MKWWVEGCTQQWIHKWYKIILVYTSLDKSFKWKYNKKNRKDNFLDIVLLILGAHKLSAQINSVSDKNEDSLQFMINDKEKDTCFYLSFFFVYSTFLANNNVFG